MGAEVATQGETTPMVERVTLPVEGAMIIHKGNRGKDRIAPMNGAHHRLDTLHRKRLCAGT